MILPLACCHRAFGALWLSILVRQQRPPLSSLIRLNELSIFFVFCSSMVLSPCSPYEKVKGMKAHSNTNLNLCLKCHSRIYKSIFSCGSIIPEPICRSMLGNRMGSIVTYRTTCTFTYRVSYTIGIGFVDAAKYVRHIEKKKTEKNHQRSDRKRKLCII